MFVGVWEFTLLIRFWLKLSGGWKGLLCLCDSIIDSDFAGLNDTSHLTAQACILARSAFSSSAALIFCFATRGFNFATRKTNLDTHEIVLLY